jgi:hypothetical protein
MSLIWDLCLDPWFSGICHYFFFALIFYAAHVHWQLPLPIYGKKSGWSVGVVEWIVPITTQKCITLTD